MRPIGGELEQPETKEKILFTDSGRSSLRLFIRSGYQDKKFLLPNFFCDVIEQVLIEEKVEYAFYNILESLEVDKESVCLQEYDVLYLINYFGMVQNLDGIDTYSTVIIEDNVFFNDFQNSANYALWYGFNSFRKVTALPDGSLIKTNLDMLEDKILQSDASFVQIKSEAKALKYHYIHDKIGEEMAYINLFEKGESLLDAQKEIHTISSVSLYHLYSKVFIDEQVIREERYKMLQKRFAQYAFEYEPYCYSFFLLKLEKRDALRSYLMQKAIYLPIHWPYSSQENRLYSSVISIPLFSHYKKEEFSHLIETIEEFFNAEHK
jgi:hypothetical protein